MRISRGIINRYIVLPSSGLMSTISNKSWLLLRIIRYPLSLFSSFVSSLPTESLWDTLQAYGLSKVLYLLYY
jgi:hypothetical protein